MTTNGPERSSSTDLVIKLGWTIGFDPQQPICSTSRERILIGAAPHCDVRLWDCGVPVLATVDANGVLTVLADEPWVFVNGSRARDVALTAGSLLTVDGVAIRWHHVEESDWLDRVNYFEPASEETQIELAENCESSQSPVEHPRIRPRVIAARRRGVGLGTRLAAVSMKANHEQNEAAGDRLIVDAQVVVAEVDETVSIRIDTRRVA